MVNKQDCPLLSFCPEVLNEIMTHLEIRDVLRFSRCSRKCREVANDPVIWKLFAAREEVTVDVGLEPKGELKKLYEIKHRTKSKLIMRLAAFIGPSRFASLPFFALNEEEKRNFNGADPARMGSPIMCSEISKESGDCRHFYLFKYMNEDSKKTQVFSICQRYFNRPDQWDKCVRNDAEFKKGRFEVKKDVIFLRHLIKTILQGASRREET